MPETKFTCRAGCWANLVIMVRRHYLANEIDCPSGIEALVEDQICAKIPKKFWTSDADDEGPVFWPDSEMMQRQRALVKEINSHRTPGYVVDDAVAKQRGHKCAGCSLNVNPFGCFSCSDHYKRAAGWRFSLFNKPPKAQGSDTYLYMCLGSGVVVLILIYATERSILPISRKIPFERLPDHCWLTEIQPKEIQNG